METYGIIYNEVFGPIKIIDEPCPTQVNLPGRHSGIYWTARGENREGELTLLWKWEEDPDRVDWESPCYVL